MSSNILTGSGSRSRRRRLPIPGTAGPSSARRPHGATGPLGPLIDIQRRRWIDQLRPLDRDPPTQQLLTDLDLFRNVRDRPAGVNHQMRGVTPIRRRVPLSLSSHRNILPCQAPGPAIKDVHRTGSTSSGRVLPTASLRRKVGAPGGFEPDLGGRGDVQHVVDLVASGAGEPVSDLLTGGSDPRGGEERHYPLQAKGFLAAVAPARHRRQDPTSDRGRAPCRPCRARQDNQVLH